MKYIVTRTRLVREVKEIVVDMPEDFDPTSYDFAQIDEYVCRNGNFDTYDTDYSDVTYDDLAHDEWQEVSS